MARKFTSPRTEVELRAALRHERDLFNRSEDRFYLKIVDACFRRFPRHDDIEQVGWKVGTLDSLYSTNLRYKTDGYKVARWIVDNHRELSRLLNTGSLEAESILEKGPAPGTHLYSFASKYAHFSNPGAFPMCDSRSYASMVKIQKLVQLRHDRSTVNQPGERWYAQWTEKVEAVRKFLRLPTLREVDKALYGWNGGEKRR